MRKIIPSLFITSLFFLFAVTPSFASSTLTVSNPRVVNNDFNIDNIVYDTQFGAVDTADPATAVSKGKIAVH